MADELRFGRGPRTPARGLNGLVALFCVTVGTFAMTRSWWEPATPEGILVEVRGDVPEPGLRAVSPPTALVALRAAGADPDALVEVPEGHLVEGQALRVEGSRVLVEAVSQPLLVALPIDVNKADPTQLAAVPGLSRRVAESIVEDREHRGAFRSLADLERVSGVGYATVERLRPFVSVSESPPVDINRATAAELETLPGIGPVLAARIVVDRVDRGAYASLDDLERVRGLRSDVVDGLRDLATATP